MGDISTIVPTPGVISPLPILLLGGQKFMHVPALFTLELLWKLHMRMCNFSGKNRGKNNANGVNLYCIFQLIIEHSEVKHE